LEKVELKSGGPPPPPPPPELEVELDFGGGVDVGLTILPEMLPVADSAITGWRRRIKIRVKQRIF